MFNLYKDKKRINIKDKHGFTLVEMIVSIAIFIVVALVAIGAFLKIIDSNKKSQTLKYAVNDLNFSIDSILREIRVGSNLYCTTANYTLAADTNLPNPSCLSSVYNGSAWAVFFYSPYSAEKTNNPGEYCRLVHSFAYRSGVLYKAEQSTCEDTITFDSGMSQYYSMTGSDVTFQGATMKVITGTISGAKPQPFAQFHFKGYTGDKEKIKSYFDLQASASQRISD